MMKLQRLGSVALLFCILTGCYHHEKRPLVSIKVFDNYVTVDGVRLDMPIQQAADAQIQSRNALVLFIPAEPLSATRAAELQHSIEQIYHSTGIGIRKVVFGCSTAASSACP